MTNEELVRWAEDQADAVRARQTSNRVAALPRGPNNHAAKLTEAQVLEIRARCAAGEMQRVVAAQYGVTQSSVSYIVSRKKWAHI